MTKRVQHVRHVGTQADAFVGLEGEFTYNITEKKINAHDGVTPGGVPTAREDLVNVAAATTATAGKMSANDKQKLDSIEAGAEINPDAAEIKSLYESNPDTNPYTDAEVAEVASVRTDLTALLNTHENDVSNPHVVTATQVGLGGVEDGAEINPPPITLEEIEEGTEVAERVVTPDVLNAGIQSVSGFIGEHKWGYFDPLAVPDGWIFGWDGTTGAAVSIGSAASGADYADDEMEVLFTILWNRSAAAKATVSGGAGASAAADFAANKTMIIPNGSGRSPLGSSPIAHNDVSARLPGETGGEEDHLNVASESGLPNHVHSYTRYNGGWVQGTQDGAPNVWINTATINTSNPVGGAQDAAAAHNTMHPFLVLDMLIKYK